MNNKADVQNELVETHTCTVEEFFGLMTAELLDGDTSDIMSVVHEKSDPYGEDRLKPRNHMSGKPNTAIEALFLPILNDTIIRLGGAGSIAAIFYVLTNVM